LARVPKQRALVVSVTAKYLILKRKIFVYKTKSALILAENISISCYQPRRLWHTVRAGNYYFSHVLIAYTIAVTFFTSIVSISALRFICELRRL